MSNLALLSKAFSEKAACGDPGAEHGTPANGACKARPPPAPIAAFNYLAGPPCCAAPGVRLRSLPFSALRLASKSSISWGNVGQSPMSSGSFFRIAFTHSLLAISFPVRCVAVLKPGFPDPGMRRRRSEGGVAQGAPAAMPAVHECSGPHERSTQLSNRWRWRATLQRRIHCAQRVDSIRPAHRLPQDTHTNRMHPVRAVSAHPRVFAEA